MGNLVIDFMGHFVDINVQSYSAGSAAILNQAAEDCVPEEGEECEWHPDTGNELLNKILYENYFEELEELVYKAIHKEQKEQLEEVAEAAYEDMRNDHGY